MATNFEIFLKNMKINPADLTPEQVENFKSVITKSGRNPDDLCETTYECFVCSICGNTITDENSHNALPVNEGRCCSVCCETVVIPARS